MNGKTSLLFALCLTAIAQTPPPQAPGYHLAFCDDFNTLSISPSGSGRSYTWYDGIWWQRTVAPLSAITNANSALTLTWLQGNTGSYETSISTLSRDAKFGHTFRYGYFEARMRWDVTNGAWPAFWMIPKQAANGAQETGEIDIFEGQGDNPHTYYGTIHDWIGKSHTSNSQNWHKLPNTVDFSQWHTYGLLWTPGKVTWYFDNEELHSAPTPAVVDRQDFFLVLGMQEGANWTEGSMSGVNASSMHLNVDWVRVWQH